MLACGCPSRSHVGRAKSAGGENNDGGGCSPAHRCAANNSGPRSSAWHVKGKRGEANAVGLHLAQRQQQTPKVRAQPACTNAMLGRTTPATIARRRATTDKSGPQRSTTTTARPRTRLCMSRRSCARCTRTATLAHGHRIQPTLGFLISGACMVLKTAYLYEYFYYK